MRVQAPAHNTYVDFPEGMPVGEIHAAMMKHFPPRPNHDDLTTAAVTGRDSLNLQAMAPDVKPVVKMTVAELGDHLDAITDKCVIIWQDSAYVIEPEAIDPAEALPDILSGDDSEILGYPERGPCDCCVTKQGEVVTDLAQMRDHAAKGNVIWAASGGMKPLMEKAGRVSAAVLRGGHDR